jgi:hypothetical protein
MITPTGLLSHIRRFQPHIIERTRSHLPLATLANSEPGRTCALEKQVTEEVCHYGICGPDFVDEKGGAGFTIGFDVVKTTLLPFAEEQCEGSKDLSSFRRG